MNRIIGSQLSHAVCLDEAMQNLIDARPRRRKIPTSVIPNWESLAEFPLLDTHDAEKSFQPSFTLLYSGNMGHGHCFETLLLAAKRLLDGDNPIEIVMTGGGVQAPGIQQRIKDEQLTNIDFKGYVSYRELRDIQSRSHCAFISLKDNMLGCMSPSKLHASLAMGLPVVYLGPLGSSVDSAITKFDCGESIRSGDIDHFIERLEILSKSPNLIKQYSRNARIAFEKSYCDQSNLSLFDAVLDDSRGRTCDRDAHNRAA
ncbi:MAG: glycosyltransferase [Pirellulales bacterium]|nr:glycosyltransferase [Pirellulales bacterium]